MAASPQRLVFVVRNGNDVYVSTTAIQEWAATRPGSVAEIEVPVQVSPEERRAILDVVGDNPLYMLRGHEYPIIQDNGGGGPWLPLGIGMMVGAGLCIFLTEPKKTWDTLLETAKMVVNFTTTMKEVILTLQSATAGVQEFNHSRSQRAAVAAQEAQRAATAAEAAAAAGGGGGTAGATALGGGMFGRRLAGGGGARAGVLGRLGGAVLVAGGGLAGAGGMAPAPALA